MQIQVLSTNVETKQGAKNSYQVLEIAYKNLTFQGKVEAKKVMSFGSQAEAFKTLVTAAQGSVWDVEVTKNDKGYNDWVTVTKGSVSDAQTTVKSHVAPTSSTGSATRGGWETPEERAKRQVYIIRQSSLSTAVATLTAGAKTPPKKGDVIELAREFEAYVLGIGSDNDGFAKSVEAKDLEHIDEDIPF